MTRTGKIQKSLLEYLRGNGQTASVVDLAKALNVAYPSIYQAGKSLARRGAVTFSEGKVTLVGTTPPQ